MWSGGEEGDDDGGAPLFAFNFFLSRSYSFIFSDTQARHQRSAHGRRRGTARDAQPLRSEVEEQQSQQGTCKRDQHSQYANA